MYYYVWCISLQQWKSADFSHSLLPAIEEDVRDYLVKFANNKYLLNQGKKNWMVPPADLIWEQDPNQNINTSQEALTDDFLAIGTALCIFSICLQWNIHSHHNRLCKAKHNTHN